MKNALRLSDVVVWGGVSHAHARGCVKLIRVLYVKMGGVKLCETGRAHESAWKDSLLQQCLSKPLRPFLVYFEALVRHRN